MIREKVLKPFRIIPDHLYVLREADRQLKSILDDMASPGYVLVSRQMGKTNLLLHAKSTYQTENDIFLYFDLSNGFNNEYECFRTVVDKILEINADKLDELKSIINENRKRNLPAHTEHLFELRLVLKKITGKLVIIYDEIDALTRASFSDKIFSQIRSIYFDRSSYSELGRLTYILSGVVEPSDIIKDPKISPFNIGEKIFLDDFSFQEHKTFLQKASLNLSEDVSNRLFHWTSGNPRMTYDISANLENLILNGEVVVLDTVDKVVKEMYLTTFDKAPVDHIRELAEQDKQIRDALTIIRYGKGYEIDDSTKIKLYLSGIVNSDFTSQNIRIKNLIIDESLSDKWLKSIEKKRKSIADLIAERISNKEYNAVKDIYNQYNELTDGKLSSNTFYNIGLAFYKTASFDKAIELFGQVNYDKIYEKSYYLETQFLLAESFGYSEQYLRAIELFRSIIEFDDGGKYFYSCKMSLAKTLIDLDPVKNAEEAINLFEEVLNNVKKLETQLDETERNTLEIMACLNYGKILVKSDRLEEAKNQFSKALEIDNNKHTPQILLELFKINDDPNKKKKNIEDILEYVKAGKLLTSFETNLYPYFAEALLFSITKELFVYSDKLFADLCEYIGHMKSENFKSSLLSMAVAAFQETKQDLAESMVCHLLFKMKGDVDIPTRVSGFHILFNIQSQKESFFEKYFSNYFQTMLNVSDYNIENSDFTILSQGLNQFNSIKDFETSRMILAFLNMRLENSDVLKRGKYIIEYYEIITLLNSQYISSAIQRSKDLLVKLNLLSHNEISSNPYLSTSLDTIKRELNHLIVPPTFTTNISETINYNDGDRVSVKYKDGTNKSNVKYKKIKEDVKFGKCVIITPKLSRLN